MSFFTVDNYTVYLRNNIIRIVTKNHRVFQVELNYNDFIFCDSNEDLYDFLCNLFTEEDIDFKIDDHKITAHYDLTIHNKTKTLTFEIPEIREKMDSKETQIIEMNSTIEQFKTQLSELTKRFEMLEKRNSNFIVLHGSKLSIPTNIDKLTLIGSQGNPDGHIGIGEMIRPTENNCYFFDHPDISNIEYLPNLTHLTIRYNSCTRNFSKLSKLTKLREIKFEDSYCLEDISFCAKLPQLSKLILRNCKKVVDINILKDCKNLTELTITGSGVINTEALTSPTLKIIK